MQLPKFYRYAGDEQPILFRYAIDRVTIEGSDPVDMTGWEVTMNISANPLPVEPEDIIQSINGEFVNPRKGSVNFPFDNLLPTGKYHYGVMVKDEKGFKRSIGRGILFIRKPVA